MNILLKLGLRAYVHAVGHEEPEEFGTDDSHTKEDSSYTLEKVAAAGELIRQDVDRRIGALGF